MKLTDKELRMAEWTVIAYLDKLETKQKTELKNNLVEFLEKNCTINLELTDKELRMTEWTLIAYLEILVTKTERTESENNLLKYLEKNCTILKKIKDGKKTNQRKN